MIRRRIFRDRILHMIGVERSHKPKSLIVNPQWQVDGLLAFVVSRQMVKNHDFYFVQVGAYDGVANDAVYEIASKYKLRGILVEPQRGAFERLAENYADCPNVFLVNGAIADEDGYRDLYTTADADSQQASFDREHLIRHHIRSDEIVASRVPCFRLKSLLRNHGFTHLDLLQIDAEGYDYEIIGSSVESVG